MTGHRIRLTNVRVKDGKVIRTHKVAAGQKKLKHIKADRLAKAWKKRGKAT